MCPDPKLFNLKDPDPDPAPALEPDSPLFFTPNYKLSYKNALKSAKNNLGKNIKGTDKKKAKIGKKEIFQ